MARWLALLFGVMGYSIVIWYYSSAFAPLSQEGARNVLWYMCLSCVTVTALHFSRLKLAFFLLGPINAAIYAAIGFVLGKFLHRLIRINNHVSEADSRQQ